jgi:hypothetical protein
VVELLLLKPFWKKRVLGRKKRLAGEGRAVGGEKEEGRRNFFILLVWKE